MTSPPDIPRSATLDRHKGDTIAAFWAADVRAQVVVAVADLLAEGHRDLAVWVYNGFTLAELGNAHEAYKTRVLQLAHVTAGPSKAPVATITINLWIDAGLVASERRG